MPDIDTMARPRCVRGAGAGEPILLIPELGVGPRLLPLWHPLLARRRRCSQSTRAASTVRRSRRCPWRSRPGPTTAAMTAATRVRAGRCAGFVVGQLHGATGAAPAASKSLMVVGNSSSIRATGLNFALCPRDRKLGMSDGFTIHGQMDVDRKFINSLTPATRPCGPTGHHQANSSGKLPRIRERCSSGRYQPGQNVGSLPRAGFDRIADAGGDVNNDHRSPRN